MKPCCNTRTVSASVMIYVCDNLAAGLPVWECDMWALPGADSARLPHHRHCQYRLCECHLHRHGMLCLPLRCQPRHPTQYVLLCILAGFKCTGVNGGDSCVCIQVCARTPEKHFAIRSYICGSSCTIKPVLFVDGCASCALLDAGVQLFSWNY